MPRHRQLNIPGAIHHVITRDLNHQDIFLDDWDLKGMTHKEELKRQGWDLNRIVNEVCHMFSVDPDDLHKKGRANGLSSAKDLICYLGYYQLGINGKELARYFGISRPPISQAIKRGEKFAKENDVKLLS
ncbi:MAG: hypothetical protein C4B58_11330 [Deltaproteobacteria bacterium]|nr:MAG: hypothetical protein C4B58_11330 [Deltaproteobacteria bacterium]